MTNPSIDRIIRDSQAECLVLSRGEAKVIVDEVVRLRVLLLTANRYVEGYAKNDNNHPQARDGARDLVRQIKEAT